jgi:hypothetical protein
MKHDNIAKEWTCEIVTSRLQVSHRPRDLEEWWMDEVRKGMNKRSSSSHSYSDLIKKTPSPEAASELYRPSDHLLSAK